MLPSDAITRARTPLTVSPLAGRSGLLKRLAPLDRLVRFGLTGGTAAMLQLLLLEWLLGQGLTGLVANVVAFIVAAQVNFWLSQTFTWRDRRSNAGGRGLAMRWLQFHGAIAGTAVLNMAIFAVASTMLPHLASAALGIGGAAAANFLIGDRLVFRRRTSAAEASTTTAMAAEREPSLAAQLVASVALAPESARADVQPDRPGAGGAGAPVHSGRPSLLLDEGEPATAHDLGRAVGRPGGPPDRRERLWAALGLAGVSLLAGTLYVWGLPNNGWANEYYAAAVLSMSQSWHSFFYGALDATGFITVDKPPFAFWIQALSVRLFGMSSWSILLPQAIMALATLLVVYTMARRQFGAPASTLAGMVLALTPISVAVARVNLPDTALILLMTLGAWTTFTAIRTGRLGPLLLGMALVGLGFNTKMLQAFLVVPAFMGTYLLVAPVTIWRRLLHLTAAGLVLLGVSASWMTVVDSVPAESRPYIGGSSDNSVLDLALGYNGLGRVFGQGMARGSSPSEIVARVASALLPSSDADSTTADGSDGTVVSAAVWPGAARGAGQAGAARGVFGGPAGAVGGPGGGQAGPSDPWNGPGSPGNGPGGGPGSFGGGPGFGGQPGWLRLFNGQVGGQIGWLLPLAGVSLLAGLIARGCRSRTDATRAWYLLWGGWALTHVVVFSFAEGIFHPYYTSALAPAVAALCGPGVVTLWQAFSRRWWLTWALPAALAGSVAISWVLVTRSEWLPWLAPAMVGTVGAGILALALGRMIGRLVRGPLGRQIALAGLTIGLAGVLAGPAAWATTPLRSGGMAVNPQAGPTDSIGFGRGGFGGPGRGGPVAQNGGPTFAGGQGGQPPAFAPAVGTPDASQVASDDGGQVGNRVGGGTGRVGRAFGPGAALASTSGAPGMPAFGGPGAPGGPGGPGSPPGRVDASMVEYLEANRGSTEYLVAVNSSMAAAPVILQTGAPVMAMGGFSGGDPAPTADQLALLVEAGKLRFVMLGGRGGGPGGRGPGGGGGTAGERTAWVEANCTAVDPSAYQPQGSETGDNNSAFRGAGAQLYDCAPGLASATGQASGG